MLVRQAKSVAEEWVHHEGSKLAGLRGAYLVGSVTTLPDWAHLPETSDVDVTVVMEDPPSKKLGKFKYQDLLLEVSFEERDTIQSAENVLGHPHLAGGIRSMHIIVDPTGHLGRLQEEVASRYSCRRWVGQRCQEATAKAEGMLQSLEESAPLHGQVTAWLFGTSLTTLILLVAGLRAPTVRRRYVEARELLVEHGRPDFYEELLKLLGCCNWSRSQAEGHLAAVAAAFDQAKCLRKGEFPYAADISDAARPVAIDGSRALIEQGLHREAVYWMVATFSRCCWIFHFNGSNVIGDRFLQSYQSMLGDLGINLFADLKARSSQVRKFLPRVTEVAEAIMAATPEIE